MSEASSSHASAHLHLCEHALPTSHSSESSSKPEVIVVIKESTSKATTHPEWVTSLISIGLSLLSTSKCVHEGVVIEEVLKRITASKELFENVVCLCEGEATSSS